MNKDPIKGRIDEVKGKVKEVTGKIVNDNTEEEEENVKKNIAKVQAGHVDIKEDIKEDN